MTKLLRFSNEHIRLIKDNFDLLDEDKDGKITRIEAGTLFRALGQTISNADMDSMLSSYFGDASQSSEGAKQAVDLPSFIKMFQSHYKDPISETVLRQAFQVFDLKNTGRMSREEFIQLMTKHGECLPQKEVDQLLMLAEVSGRSGEFDYSLLSHRLITGPTGVFNI